MIPRRLVAFSSVLLALAANPPAAAASAAAPSAMTLPYLNWEKLPPLPDPEGFAAMFAGVAGDALLVAGGARFMDKRPWEGGTKLWDDTVWALAEPRGAWRKVGRLPRAAAYGLSVTTPAGVLCAGGSDAKTHFADTFLLTWDGRELRTKKLPDLPRPAAHHSGVLAGVHLYAVGGTERPDSTEPLHTFWVLDTSRPDSGWRELPPCPGPARLLAVVGAIGDTVYVASGVGLHAGPDGKPVRTYLQDAYAYTPARGWKRLADLPHPVAAAASPAPVTPDGQLLTLTGDDGTLVHLNGPRHPGFQQAVLAYRPAEDRWIKVGTTPFSRATVPTTVWHGKWIVPNGERIPGYRSPEVWSLEFTPPR
jgi:N-acetylneuraminic acid mutarotase